MKGVSAVIAVILILMIVVALAALAYTWFTGIFSSLTETTGENIMDTTESMSKQFSLDAASCSSGDLQFTIRNTGSGTLSAGSVAAFLNGTAVTDLARVGGSATIAEGATQTFNGTIPACAANEVLRVTIENGVSNSVTL